MYVTVHHICQFLGSVAKSHARNYFISSSHILLKWSTKSCHVTLPLNENLFFVLWQTFHYVP